MVRPDPIITDGSIVQKGGADTDSACSNLWLSDMKKHGGSAYSHGDHHYDVFLDLLVIRCRCVALPRRSVQASYIATSNIWASCFSLPIIRVAEGRAWSSRAGTLVLNRPSSLAVVSHQKETADRKTDPPLIKS